jgi:hypothetical protein
MNLAARLSEALVQLTPDRPEAIESMRPLYAADVVFRDPIQEVHGIDAFVAMNHPLLRRMRSLEWSIRTAKGDDAEVFLEWTARGKTKLGLKVSVDGMTRAQARNGRIYDHRDCWDLGELIASSVPGGKRILPRHARAVCVTARGSRSPSSMGRDAVKLSCGECSSAGAAVAALQIQRWRCACAVSRTRLFRWRASIEHD